MNCRVLVVLVLPFVVVLTAFSLSASHESTWPLLPEEVMAQIVPHCHQPSMRGVNRYWRDALVMHIEKPIALRYANMPSGYHDKKAFFYAKLLEHKLYTDHFWIFDNPLQLEFFFVVVRAAHLREINIQIDDEKELPCSFFSTCADFVKQACCVQQLAIEYTAKKALNTSNIVPILASAVAGQQNLRKFTLSLNRSYYDSPLIIVPETIEFFNNAIAENTSLQEVTFEVGHDAIRLRPYCPEDMRWFKFVCNVKKGSAVVSGKSKAHGNPHPCMVCTSSQKTVHNV